MDTLDTELLDAYSQAVVGAVELVGPSVVTVEIGHGEDRRAHGQGSGFVVAPDGLIVQDPTLLHQVDLFAGLAPDSYVLINTTRSFDELGLGEFADGFDADRLVTVPAKCLQPTVLVHPNGAATTYIAATGFGG